MQFFSVFLMKWITLKNKKLILGWPKCIIQLKMKRLVSFPPEGFLTIYALGLNIFQNRMSLQNENMNTVSEIIKMKHFEFFLNLFLFPL